MPEFTASDLSELNQKISDLQQFAKDVKAAVVALDARMGKDKEEPMKPVQTFFHEYLTMPGL